MAKIKIPAKLRDQLWWLIIGVDYDYSRVTIADHELTDEGLTLWLEDKEDFKNTLEECLQVRISQKEFARLIRAENLNSYEGTRMHPVKNFVYKTRIEISAPIKWYQEDATQTEQLWAREMVVKKLLEQLVESEITDKQF